MNELRKAASFTAGVVLVVAAFWCGGYDFTRGYLGVMCVLSSIGFGFWLAVLVELSNTQTDDLNQHNAQLREQVSYSAKRISNLYQDNCELRSDYAKLRQELALYKLTKTSEELSGYDECKHVYILDPNTATFYCEHCGKDGK